MLFPFPSRKHSWRLRKLKTRGGKRKRAPVVTPVQDPYAEYIQLIICEGDEVQHRMTKQTGGIVRQRWRNGTYSVDWPDGTNTFEVQEKDLVLCPRDHGIVCSLFSASTTTSMEMLFERSKCKPPTSQPPTIRFDCQIPV